MKSCFFVRWSKVLVDTDEGPKCCLMKMGVDSVSWIRGYSLHKMSGRCWCCCGSWMRRRFSWWSRCWPYRGRLGPSLHCPQGDQVGRSQEDYPPTDTDTGSFPGVLLILISVCDRINKNKNKHDKNNLDPPFIVLKETKLAHKETISILPQPQTQALFLVHFL